MNEKEGSLDDPEETLKGEENSRNSDQTKEESNIHNSINSMGSGGGGTQEEEPRKEGVTTSKESLIQTMSGDSKEDVSSNQVECSTHREQQETNQNTRKGSGDILANFKERTGASSPSPSVG